MVTGLLLRRLRAHLARRELRARANVVLVWLVDCCGWWIGVVGGLVWLVDGPPFVSIGLTAIQQPNRAFKCIVVFINGIGRHLTATQRTFTSHSEDASALKINK